MKKAILRVATSLNEQMIKSICEGFEGLLGGPIEFDIIKDETLIGGFIAFIGGKVYDASMSTQLSDMRRSLSDDNIGG
ncbi:MAG: F0F1 ATP synthase subunit delta [Eubacteriales bacterium]